MKMYTLAGILSAWLLNMLRAYGLSFEYKKWSLRWQIRQSLRAHATEGSIPSLYLILYINSYFFKNAKFFRFSTLNINTLL